jgi:6-phosphogluconate dehydrogenase
MGSQRVGIVGLGVMGENLALNIARNGYTVAGFDLDGSKVDSFAHRTAGTNAVAAHALPEFVGALAVPRVILIMVPAGKPVDAVINDLTRKEESQRWRQRVSFTSAQV